MSDLSIAHASTATEPPPTPAGEAPPWYHQLRDAIAQTLGTAVQAFAEAGRLYAQGIDRDPAFKGWLADSLPDVSGSLWRKLEAVGRGALDPRVATGCAWGDRLARLPISDQQQALDGMLPLLTEPSTGDHLLVRLDNLLPAQADQVFARDHIRTVEQQRAWMEARSTAARTAARAAQVAPSIEIDRRHRRAIIGGVSLSQTDLLDVVRRLAE